MINPLILPFFHQKMSDFSQISSHGIYFSSDEILKTSHKILFLWEEIEKALESVQYLPEV